MKIGIVGIGLIGGSMAKSIKAKTGHEVYAADRDSETMLLARMCGAIDGELNEDTLHLCDMVFLALCPEASVNWARENGGEISKTATVIDFCGVKRTVCKAMREIADKYGFTYIGGHPMAGKERGGFINSTANLYDGASMILTPGEKTEPHKLEEADKLFTDVGFGRIVYSTPEEHDRIIAFTSQLAHIVSSAYVKSPEAQRQRGFSAGSFRDMTRVAYLDENMWTELFLADSDNLLHELGILIGNLQEYYDALEKKDGEKLNALLKHGRECKIAAGGN